MKRQFILILVLALLLCGCNAAYGRSPYKTIKLTQEEKDVLRLIESDIHTVDAENLSDTIADINEHPDNYIGQVYCLEGIFSLQTVHGEATPYLIPKTAEGAEAVGIPIRYLEKEVEENAPIRITAIINSEAHDGHSHMVLETITVESAQN